MSKPVFEELASRSLVREIKLNEKLTAWISGKSVKTLRNERSLMTGVPYYKPGKNVVYRFGDILNYLEARKAHTIG